LGSRTFHRRQSDKRRAPQGQLRNLTTGAREQLHSWFREQKGELPYHEIRKRLRESFDIKVGFSTLSNYYNAKAEEIWAGPREKRESAGTKTIVIRIEVPAGHAIAVSTEEHP
jgi:hypothetical protein